MTKKILVSQPRPASSRSPYTELAEHHDVELTFHSFIRIEPMNIVDFRKQHINLPDYTAIVFTSKFAIEHFFRICEEARYQVPETLKYFAVSESVANYIQKFIVYRKRKVFFGKTGVWSDLVEVMMKHASEKYLLPLSDTNTGSYTETLAKTKKLNYTPCVMYLTVSNALPAKELLAHDALVLFTPAGVEALQSTLPAAEQGALELITWGPATARAAEEAGYRVAIQAPTQEVRSVTAAIEKYLTAEAE